MIWRVLAIGFVLTLVLAAAGPAQATTRGHARTSAEIDTIVVHAISGPYCAGGKLAFSGADGDAERWKKFFDTHPFLGIHYVVDREGVVLASTPELVVANHARNANDTTIGIELVHEGDGEEPFSDKQFEALIELIKGIRSRHRIPIENIKGHSDVDQRLFSCGGKTYKTKLDPGPNFPWASVRAALEPPRLIKAPTLVSRRPAGPSRRPGTMQ